MLSGFNLLQLEQSGKRQFTETASSGVTSPPTVPNCGRRDQMRNLSTSQAIFPSSEFFHFSPQWTKCLLGARMAEGTGRDNSSWTLPT